MTYNKNNIIPEIFAATISIVAGIMTYISRIGFDNDGILIIKCILICFFVIFSPNLLRRIFFDVTGNEWFVSKSFLMCICLGILVLVGRIGNAIDIHMSYHLSFLGAISCLATFKYNRIGTKYYIYFIFILISVWMIAIYSIGEASIHPLMKEKIVTGAYAHRETIWHAAMAGMIKTYAFSSTGLDGLVQTYYHVGSHLIYGSISGLLDISTISFYNIVLPILMIPVFFLGLIYCVREMSEYFSNNLNFKIVNENDVRYWLVMIVFIVILRERTGVLGSHGTAILLSFILMGYFFSLINTFQLNEKVVDSPSYKIFIILLPFFIFIIAFVKISFIYLINVICLYYFIRLKLYKSFWNIISAVGCFVIAPFFLVKIVFAFQEVSAVHAFNESGGPIIPGHKALSYYISEFISYHHYIYPSLIYIVLKLYCMGINSFTTFRNCILHKNLLDVELLVLLIIASFIPPLPHIKDFQMYVVLLLFLSHLNLFLERLLLKNYG